MVCAVSAKPHWGLQVFDKVAVEVTASGDAADEALHNHAHKYDEKTEKVLYLCKVIGWCNFWRDLAKLV
jgi:hypothetical protein